MTPGQDIVTPIVETKAQGRRECEATHDEFAGSCFDSGWFDGYEDGMRRGRLQGAWTALVAVGLLVAVTFALRRRL